MGKRKEKDEREIMGDRRLATMSRGNERLSGYLTEALWENSGTWVVS